MAANNIYIQVDFNSQTAQQNVNALNNAIAQTGPTSEKSAKQATAGLNTISVSVQQVNREFSQLTSAIAGLGIARAIAGMVQMSAELSRSKAAMESFTGSAEEANKVFEEVRAIAATSPFRFKELEEGTQKLLGFGFAAKNVTFVMKEISDQAARMGTGIEGVNTIVNVFGRIMEKNFVSATDLMRALPAQGIPALKALAAAMQQELGRPIDVEEAKAALKQGILDPLQTIRVILDSMKSKGDASKFSDDAARAFKNLADALDNALTKLFGPQGFGPALSKLGREIGEALAPIGSLIQKLMDLPEPKKEMIVNWLAAGAAIAAFGTALGIVVTLADPLIGLAGAIGKFTISLAAMNPELAIGVALFAAAGIALYKFVPQVQKFADDLGDTLKSKIKGVFTDLAGDAKNFFAEAFKGGEAIPPKSLVNTDALFEELKQAEQKHANEASHTLLEALQSPAEAVRAKYATLFAELEEKIKDFKNQTQKDALRGILAGAESSELAAARMKDAKQQIDEVARYNAEKVKGSYDAQIAYIEAMDAQDLRGKVAAIDKITALRIASADKVAKVQDDALQQQFAEQSQLLEDHRAELEALGVHVTEAVDARRAEMVQKQKLIDEKAADEGQKYRLEGWKKANDIIIEDQKRVFEAFKSGFDQIFDALTGKNPGKAIAEVFKSLALNEAKNIFSSSAASAATAAAGYGLPEEGITKGGIIGQLLRRGMPPRPPGPPPGLFNPARSDTNLTFGGEANRMEISANTYDTATVRFALAVAKFTSVSTQGSADRSADDGPSASEASLLTEIRRRESGGNYGALVSQIRGKQRTASGAYQFTDGTWKMATQATHQGAEYKHAMDAPPEVQDANALWLLRRAGPNSTMSWAASGPYDVGGGATPTNVVATDMMGGADMPTGAREATEVAAQMSGGGLGYGGGRGNGTAGLGIAATRALQQVFSSPGGGAPSVPAALFPATAQAFGGPDGGPMSMDQMMALPTVAHVGMQNVAPSLLTKSDLPAGVQLLEGLKSSFSTPHMTGVSGALSSKGAAQLYAAAGMPLLSAGVFGNARGTGLGVAEAGLGGMFTGAAIGTSITPGIGTAIGAGVGLAAGTLTGVGEMLAGVESPQHEAKRVVKQLYGLNINNATANAVVSVAQQSYAGRVSLAVRSPEVRHMLGLYAAGTGQNMPASASDPHGASLVESGGNLSQQATYQYGRAYTQPSNLPTYGNVPSTTLPAAGLSLSLNIGGQDAAKFMTGQVVTPDIVQTQYASAMNGSSGRVAQALMMSEPGAIAS